MAIKRQGLRTIKTMAGLSDGRRIRTVSGALLEMATLANERERLQREVTSAEGRIMDIRNRFAEITDKEIRLQKFIKEPVGSGSLLKAGPDLNQAQFNAKEFNY